MSAALRREPAQVSFDFEPPDDAPPSLDQSGFRSGNPIFFAIQPPPNTAACISELARRIREKHQLTGKPLRPRCLHVSVLFAGYDGRLRPRTRAALVAAGASIRMAPFRVGFDWAESFRHPSQRPLVLRGDDGVGGVTDLREKLIAATIGIPGVPPSGRAFTPHLTLLYDEQMVREEPIEQISWPVGEFALVRSIHGEARHVVLARWRLSG